MLLAVNHRLAPILSLLLIAWLGHRLEARAQTPRELHYFEIPPMMFADAKGQAAGIWLERLRLAWPPGAAMPVLRSAPLKRSLHDVLEAGQPICVIGVFKTPEREAKAWFSSPIFRESPSVFIAPKALVERMRKYPNAQALVTDRHLRLLLTDGASYGPLDAWIRQRGTDVLRVSTPPARQVHMLLRGRADLMFSDQAQASALLKELGEAGRALEWFVLPGMVEPPARHLMCQRNLDPSWLAALDARLAALDHGAQASP